MNYNPILNLLEFSKNHPNRLCLKVGEKSFTFSELSLYGRTVASWVLKNVKNVNPRIGILASRSIEAYSGILGVLVAGATYVPMNPKLPPSRLEAILEQAGLDALILDPLGKTALSKLNPSAKLPDFILAPDRNEGEIIPRSASECSPVEDAIPMSSQDLAYIMFTSGTTGNPKGVMVSTGALKHFIHSAQSIYNLTLDDRISQHSEISFDFSVLDIFIAWESGGSLFVVPESQVMAPARFIQENAITFWTSVPSVIFFLNELKQLKPDAFPSIRFSFFCGEALPTSSARMWQAAAPNSLVDSHYGPTEATVACAYYRLAKTKDANQETKNLAIGLPYPNMHLAILNTEDHFLKNGERGELAISGPQLASGYLHRPDLNTSRFVKLIHPELGEDIWYKTGDFAVCDESGLFHHLGRVDNQVKIGGHRIELEDIEANLRIACASDAAAVIAWPVENGIAAGLFGFYSGSDLSPAEIREDLKRRVPSYMVPRKLNRIDKIPMTSNGKVDRKALIYLLETKATT